LAGGGGLKERRISEGGWNEIKDTLGWGGNKRSYKGRVGNHLNEADFKGQKKGDQLFYAVQPTARVRLSLSSEKKNGCQGRPLAQGGCPEHLDDLVKEKGFNSLKVNREKKQNKGFNK